MGQNPPSAQTWILIMKPVIDSEWEKLKPNPIPPSDQPPKKWWMYSISPSFPSIWPPNPNSTLYHYIYAQGHDFTLGLVDAVYIGAPWARVELDIKGKKPPGFKSLSSKLKELGIQGVRPLNQEETAIFEKEVSVEAFLGSLASLPDEKEKSVSELRKYYCCWLKLNGAIAQEINPFHPEFFEWLGIRTSAVKGKGTAPVPGQSVVKFICRANYDPGHGGVLKTYTLERRDGKCFVSLTERSPLNPPEPPVSPTGSPPPGEPKEKKVNASPVERQAERAPEEVERFLSLLLNDIKIGGMKDLKTPFFLHPTIYDFEITYANGRVSRFTYMIEIDHHIDERYRRLVDACHEFFKPQ